MEEEVVATQRQLQGQLDEGVLHLLVDGRGRAEEADVGVAAAARQAEAAQRHGGVEGDVEVVEALAVRQGVEAQTGAEAHMVVEPVGVVHAEAQGEAGVVVPVLVSREGHGADAEALEVHRHLVARELFFLRLHCRGAQQGHRGGHYYCRFCCFHCWCFFL